MNETGVLLHHLPALYQTRRNTDLHDLLSVLEAVLFGDSVGKPPGLEARIAGIPDIFSPSRTRAEFLPWLSEWVALSQAEHLPKDQVRRLIADIVPLYAQRGTKTYLARLLGYFLPEGLDIIIDEHAQPGLRLGYSKLGMDSRLEGEIPFWFALRLRYKSPLPEHPKEVLEQTVRLVTDRAKPAHTSYDIVWE